MRFFGFQPQNDANITPHPNLPQVGEGVNAQRYNVLPQADNINYVIKKTLRLLLEISSSKKHYRTNKFYKPSGSEFVNKFFFVF